VFLRYAFNSGITISDEMARYCFIWLTYIGAMVAMREGGHLGVILIKHLPAAGQKSLPVPERGSDAWSRWFPLGTLEMHELQVTNVSPVAGLSMIWVFGIGYVVSVVMGTMNIRVLIACSAGVSPRPS